MSLTEGATFRGSGENAFVIEFGDEITQGAGAQVAALAAAFDAAAPAGLVEVVPTFRSLLVLFDPAATDRDALLAALPEGTGEDTARGPAHWRLPVAMEGDCAEDIADAAAGLGLSVEALRSKFLEGRYQVGMYGFAPGFAYLSGVDETLAIPRRPSPRPPMPAGSLILAGGMAALTSISMPTGWYVIGRTAVTLFRPDETPMVPFAVGDTIAFDAVSEDEWASLARTTDGGLTKDDG
ncbi:carboxyltransferase domain-containing protein [Acuticoccus sp. MNP-M23]|uniref:5-oxoprolinase subunit B family protein n=1 Tax=Acuticoccus sp. MNP-M23 TaxID=3072793 RepID=UPI002815BA21|nr:carboxyltransferase domain-containing protein [Acuticoccus sp. MNP-M23]WMS44256.1 carboxyltransferase domain-containing protein [Acuticoccus sp. MNP-M23]